MNVTCSATPVCPIILNSTCVFYEGVDLTYIGVTTNDSIQTALEKINNSLGNYPIPTLQQVTNSGNTVTVPSARGVGIHVSIQDITTYQAAFIGEAPLQTSNTVSTSDIFVARLNGQAPTFIPGYVGGFVSEMHGNDNIGHWSVGYTDAGNSAGFVSNSIDGHTGVHFQANKIILDNIQTVFQVDNDGSVLGNSFTKINGQSTEFLKADGSIDSNTYLTNISGITAGGELSGTYPNPTLVNSAVISKVLTGLNITGGTISNTDSILNAFGKLQNQVNGLIGGSVYQGTWNANTNVPFLQSGVGITGHYYVTSVAGTTDLDGNNNWHVGDWAIFNGVNWQIVDNTDAVSSVNGYLGNVSLSTGDILEGPGTLPGRPSQLFFTNSRARTAISSSATGLSYDNVTGIFTVSTGYVIPTTSQETNWNDAYTDRYRWDGGSTGIVAGTGRTSLGATTIGSNIFTSTNPDAITFLRANADNSISWLDAASFRTAIGAGTSTVTPSALTKTDDTNVTLTLGGSPNVSLLEAVSITVGWSGTLADSRITSAATWNAKQSALLGTGLVKSVAGTISYITDNSTNWNNAYSNMISTLTTIGNSGSANLSFGTLNIPTYTLAGLGGQPLLTNPITGTGTTNYISKFTGTSALGNSLIYDNGTNVGIGTASPGFPLTVSKSSNSVTSALSASLNIANSLSTLGDGVTTFNKSTLLIQSGNGVVDVRMRADYDSVFSGGLIGSFSAHPIKFVTAGADRMIVTSDGNVSIGTNTPFTWGGTAKVSIYTSTSNEPFTFANSNTDAFNIRRQGIGVYQISTTANGGNDNGVLQLQPYGLGRVGIGTLTPSTKFHVNGLSTFQGTTGSDGGQLGSELLTTGTSDASWTGTDFASGYTHVIGSVTPITSTLSAVINKVYQITWIVTGRTAGSFNVSFGGQVFNFGFYGNGNIGPKATTTENLVITPSSDFDGKIVASIKEITAGVAHTTILNGSGGINYEIRTTTSSMTLGYGSGKLNTTGGSNLFIGNSAGASNTTGSENVYLGSNSAINLLTGNYNIAIGNLALNTNRSGSRNTAIGRTSLYQSTGASNTSIGSSSFYELITGDYNVAIGQGAGYQISGGLPLTSLLNSVLIGSGVKALNNGDSNSIVIGYNSTGLGSNTTVLGNASTVQTWLGGRVTIGTTVDDGSTSLQVAGAIKGTSTLNLSAQTASTLASFDSAKNIVSLPTATYPSLAEIAYVKGVTSSIQTQINARQSVFTGTANYLPKSLTSTALGVSRLQDTGTYFGIGTVNIPDKDFTLGYQSNREVGIELSDSSTVGRDLIVTAGKTINYQLTSEFVSFQSSIQYSTCIAGHVSGNVYLGVASNNSTRGIWKRSNGVGVFSLFDGSYNVNSMTCLPNGSIYVITDNNTIRKKTTEGGAYITETTSIVPALGSRLASDIYNNIYLLIPGGLIYKKTNDSGSFVLMTITARNYSQITCHPDGSIYASVFNGDMYVYTSLTGNFNPLSQIKSWSSITCTTNGDLYGLDNNGQGGYAMWVLRNGAINFTLLSSGINYAFIGSDYIGNVYASGSFIYMQNNNSLGTTDLQGGTLKLKAGTGKGTGQSRIQLITGQKTTSGTDMQVETVRAEIDENGYFKLTTMPTFADNAAALTGGLVAGQFYRTATGILMITY